MRLENKENVYVETEVNLSVDDITATLAERLETLDEKYESLERFEGAQKRELLAFINAVWQCLNAVSGIMIESLTDDHRKIIAEALQKEAERYSTVKEGGK